jgi:uncharacterized peroxidase-related enzyme
VSRLKTLEKSQASPKSQTLMAELESKKMLSNMFRGMANGSAVLDAFLKFVCALRQGQLDAKTRHSIALVISQADGCEYCVAAHAVLGKGAGLDDRAIHDARLGRSADKKTSAAMTLALQVLDTRGGVSDADVSAARAAGLDDGDVAEVIANVALNLFANYFNNFNQSEVDFPKVSVNIS